MAVGDPAHRAPTTMTSYTVDLLRTLSGAGCSATGVPALVTDSTLTPGAISSPAEGVASRAATLLRPNPAEANRGRETADEVAQSGMAGEMGV